ncbi:non-ribosomal peptide synthetase, partial [Gloeocapsopsis crepidinum]|uniref:non-ribosomal peptide synthetase n=1 Tax=Gloeocapsopsis crepidinum TaxID=693223 RepID=UPI003F6E9213
VLQSGLECHSLKNVICSGEALDYELQEKFFEHCNAKLYNLYGPTEASIDVTWWICQPDQMRIVPIGSPIANTQIYIVDRYLQPVPIGVPGELHIGGVGLARGYWQRPDLTAEKFIPNPFSTEPGDYLYKTGDLARYLPDGNIEYLGRIDDQVKIRGFRIELGEIAAQLNQHPPVQQAIAIARQGDIVAYVASQTHETLTSKELRHFLQEKLPQYMLPSAFVILPEFPLTPNGKLDRKVLPAPEVRRSDLETYVVPQTDWEKAIAQVWRKVLNLEQISIDDNFFELGGHSLLLAQVHSQLREMITVDFSILDMFRYPTIRLLAEYLNQTTVEIRDISTEKIAAGKAQQRKRLQKIKNINYE